MIIPTLTLPPLSRTTLALYAAGSGDHVPLHIDSDFARDAGYPDVFMHGMLGCGYLARMVTGLVEPRRVRRLTARFVAITFPGEELTASGAVVERGVDGVPGRCRLALELRNAAGERKLVGSAVVDLEEDPG